VYLLRSKDEALESFIHYKKEVNNQLNKKIKVLRSDRGREYNHLLVNFVHNMVLFIKPLLPIHLNKIELLNGKIEP
jgi:hypothetical protein